MLHAPSLSGQGPQYGVASTYLSSLSKGDAVQVTIQNSRAGFSLPTDPETTPIICVAAGTGIAPFRGFVQERAVLLASGRRLAPAVLFYGCRAQERDDLYRAEFDEWQREGAVEVRRAYSCEPEESEGCRYAQERMVRDAELIAEMWQSGANLYVCGSKALAGSALAAMVGILRDGESEIGGDASTKGIQEWFESLRNIRYFTDVFD